MNAVVSVSVFVAGLVIVLGTLGSVIRTTILPRALASRLSVFVGRRIVFRTFLHISYRFEHYETKDKLLAFGAPIALMTLLVVWLILFVLGYALMIWGVTGAAFVTALRESGSSIFTLGLAGRDHLGASILFFAAAFTGLIVIALQIAYLPTLYGAFNRREVLVTMLQSRAGAPAWGPEILARSHMVNLMDELPSLYAEWERWAAEVMESHTTYTVLIWFRSPHPLRSWIVGLLALLDSAAMYLALSPNAAPTEARLVLRMGFTCLRSIADTLGIPYDGDPYPDDPIELTFDEFQAAVDRLRAIDFPIERDVEEAWPHFKGWRVNYESIAYALADGTVAPPGPWSGPRNHLPGVAIVPQRPPNRTPDDRRDHESKLSRFGWHA